MSLSPSKLYVTVSPLAVPPNPEMTQLGLPSGFISTELTQKLTFNIQALNGRQIESLMLRGQYLAAPISIQGLTAQQARQRLALHGIRYTATGGIGAYALFRDATLYASSGTIIGQNSDIPRYYVEQRKLLGDLQNVCDYSQGNFFSQDHRHAIRTDCEALSDVFAPFCIDVPTRMGMPLLTSLTGNLTLDLNFANPIDTMIDTQLVCVQTAEGVYDDTQLPVPILNPQAGDDNQLLIIPNMATLPPFLQQNTGNRMRFVLFLELLVTYGYEENAQTSSMTFDSYLPRQTYIPVNNGLNNNCPIRLFGITATDSTFELTSVDMQVSQCFGRYSRASWGSTNTMFILDQQNPTSTYPLQSQSDPFLFTPTMSAEQLTVRRKHLEDYPRFLRVLLGKTTSFAYGMGKKFSNSLLSFTTTMRPLSRFRLNPDNYIPRLDLLNTQTYPTLLPAYTPEYAVAQVDPITPAIAVPYQMVRVDDYLGSPQYTLTTHTYFMPTAAFRKARALALTLDAIYDGILVNAPASFGLRPYFPTLQTDNYLPTFDWNSQKVNWLITTNTVQKTMISSMGTAIGQGPAHNNTKYDHFTTFPGCVSANTSPFIPMQYPMDKKNPLLSFNTSFQRTLMMAGNVYYMACWVDMVPCAAPALAPNSTASEEVIESVGTPVAGWSDVQSMAFYRYAPGIVGRNAGLINSLSLSRGTGTVNDVNSRVGLVLAHLSQTNPQRIQKYLRDGGGLPMTDARTEGVSTVAPEHIYSDSMVPFELSLFVANTNKGITPYACYERDVSSYKILESTTTGINLEYSPIAKAMTENPLVPGTTLTIEFDTSNRYYAHVGCGGGAFSHDVRNPFQHVAILTLLNDLSRVNNAGALMNTHLRRNCTMLSTYVKVTSTTPRLSLLTSVAHNQTQLMNTVYANENAPTLHIMQLFEDSSTVTIPNTTEDFLSLNNAIPPAISYALQNIKPYGLMNSFNKPAIGSMFNESAMNIGNNPDYLVVQRMPGSYDPSGFQIYIPPLTTPLNGFGYGSAACSLPMVGYCDSLTGTNPIFPTDLNFTPTARPQFNGASLDSVNPVWDRYRYLSQYEMIFGRRPVGIEYRDFTTQKTLQTPRYGSMRMSWNTLTVARTPTNVTPPRYTVYSMSDPVPTTVGLIAPGCTTTSYCGHINREMIQKVIHAPAPNFWEFMDLGVKSQGATQLTMNYHFNNLPLHYSTLLNTPFSQPNLRHPPSLPAIVDVLPVGTTAAVDGQNVFALETNPNLALHELMWGFSYANAGHFTEVRILVSDNVYKQTLSNIYSVSSH